MPTQTYPSYSVVSRLLWIWFCYQQLLHWALKHRQPGSGQQLRLHQVQQAEPESIKVIWIHSQRKICACVIPEWIPGSAGGPAGLLAPTQQALFYDSGWRNKSQPSLQLCHTAHPEHLSLSQDAPFLLPPETGYTTGHLLLEEGQVTIKILSAYFDGKLLHQMHTNVVCEDCQRETFLFHFYSLSLMSFLPIVCIFCVTKSVSAPTLAAAAAASVPACPPPTTMTSYCCLARWLTCLETSDRKLCTGGSFFVSMWDIHLSKHQSGDQTFELKDIFCWNEHLSFQWLSCLCKFCHMSNFFLLHLTKQMSLYFVHFIYSIPLQYRALKWPI